MVPAFRVVPGPGPSFSEPLRVKGPLPIVAIPLRNSLLLIWLRRAPATKCLEFNLDGPIMVLEEVEAVLNLAQQDF